jgi:hypothetical protein
MTKREFYKYLKQEKLFSKFCAYLATCYETKCITHNNNLIYYYKRPKSKLDEFIKSNVETRTSPEGLINYVRNNWSWHQQPKIVYGKKRKKFRNVKVMY